MPLLILFLLISLFMIVLLWNNQNRKYQSGNTVATAYDQWTNDQLLERLWGDHVHLGFYEDERMKKDFRIAKIDLVHELVHWSGLNKLPRGSRILDVGCGIGGSARILASEYGFDVLGISISPAQIKRANQLTSKDLLCRFQTMDALDLKIENGHFDAVWSVEAGPHMPNKQLYADEMLRVLRPDGVLAVADWNVRQDSDLPMTKIERLILNQLLNQWAHPEFSSIEGFKRNLLESDFSGGLVETSNWSKQTTPSWLESIYEGFRRPKAVLDLGIPGLIKGFREVPTILLMHWAFSKGLMEFGVFKARG